MNLQFTKRSTAIYRILESITSYTPIYNWNYEIIINKVNVNELILKVVFIESKSKKSIEIVKSNATEYDFRCYFKVSYFLWICEAEN